MSILKHRICEACDSTETHKDKNGYEKWHNHDGHCLCNRCYSYYVLHPIWNKITHNKWNPITNKKWNPINNKKQLLFKNKKLLLKESPRTGICQICGAVKGIDCKMTSMHHRRYHDNDPLQDTIEVCNRCHKLEHKRMNKK